MPPLNSSPITATSSYPHSFQGTSTAISQLASNPSSISTLPDEYSQLCEAADRMEGGVEERKRITIQIMKEDKQHLLQEIDILQQRLQVSMSGGDDNKVVLLQQQVKQLQQQLQQTAGKVHEVEAAEARVEVLEEVYEHICIYIYV